MNRLQNTDRVLLADAVTGGTRTVLTEQDSAWVDVVDEHPVARGAHPVPVDHRARRLAPRLLGLARRAARPVLRHAGQRST